MSKWEIDNSESALLDRKHAGMFYIISDERSDYPEPVVVAETMSESAANLIAAAPDLLEACKEISSYLGALNPFKHDLHVLELCRKAIKKAEGNND